MALGCGGQVVEGTACHVGPQHTCRTVGAVGHHAAPLDEGRSLAPSLGASRFAALYSGCSLGEASPLMSLGADLESLFVTSLGEASPATSSRLLVLPLSCFDLTAWIVEPFSLRRPRSFVLSLVDLFGEVADFASGVLDGR